MLVMGNNEFSPATTVRGFLVLSIKDLVASLAAAVFFVFVARIFPSPSDLGIITGLQTLTAMFIIFSSLGLARSGTRFISMFNGANRPDNARTIYFLVFTISLISSFVFSIVLWILAPPISELLFHDNKQAGLIELTAIDVFFFSIANFSIFLLYASQKFFLVTTISIINSVIKFPLSLILAYAGYGLEGIIFGLIIGDGITSVLYIYPLLSKIKGARVDILILKSLARYSAPLYGSLILNYLSTKVDIYLLLILSSLYLVGVYSPAVYIASTFFIFLSALEQALLPYTSRIFGNAGLNSMSNSSLVATRYLFLFYIPLGFLIISSCPSLIPLILGDRYSDSVIPTIIILISITLTSIGTVFNNLLRSSGRTGTMLVADSLSLSVQTGICLISIPAIGIIGAALARAVARLVFFVYPAYRLDKLGGLAYDKVALRVGAAGAAIITLLIIPFSYLLPPHYQPGIYALAIVSYLFLLRVTRGLNKKDIDFINNILSGRMKWSTMLLAKIVIH